MNRCTYICMLPMYMMSVLQESCCAQDVVSCLPTSTGTLEAAAIWKPQPCDDFPGVTDHCKPSNMSWFVGTEHVTKHNICNIDRAGSLHVPRMFKTGSFLVLHSDTVCCRLAVMSQLQPILTGVSWQPHALGACLHTVTTSWVESFLGDSWVGCSLVCDGKWVACLDEEVVVEAPMLVVMHQCRPQGSYLLPGTDCSHLHQTPVAHHHVGHLHHCCHMYTAANTRKMVLWTYKSSNQTHCRG